MHKPFDLEAALAGKPVVAEHPKLEVATKVIGIVHLPEAIFRKVAAVLSDGTALFFSGTGVGLAYDNGYTLKMEAEERTGYVNVWRNEDHGQPFIHSETHYSLQQAEAERTISCKGYKKTLIARLPFQYNFPDMTKVETNG